ncbi:MAG: glutamine amidotransferase [Collinsella sp.]|nr:glutamine amidotransferase [Collinsella sp.]
MRIVYLYPDALNLYGDGGNVIALERRCAWRGIPVRVDEVRMGEVLDLHDADIVMMGGGSDRDQLAVAHELLAQKDKVAAYVEDGGSLLAICGSYQLLGRSYYMGEDRIEGLGIIAAETVRGSNRLIGNVAVKTDLAPEPFVGFENHGGRTLLDADATPLGTSVVTGTGNNGDDGFEGLIYKGVIGTYLHGPALPKNPELADWLITHALERRGDAQATALLPLKPLDDTYEHAAHDAAMKLLS